MNSQVINELTRKMTSSLENLENRFNNVQAGRANPSILDGIMIDYYGVATPLRTLANISIPEARQLMIKPFDRSILDKIEKAIFEKDLGLTPNNNGECIFIVIPALTEERRKELVKQVKGLAEEARIAIRNIRQDANNEIKKVAENDDEEKRTLDKIQDVTNEFNKNVDLRLDEKEKELMSI